MIYRVGVSAIHRIVPAVISAQATHLPSGSGSAEEVSKRIRTIEELLLKLLRVGVLAGLVVLALGVFELWAVLAGIILLIVAVVFATRDVVLDYVMGFLILVEGPYFNGDYIVVNGHPGVEGVVEEIGLRRTLLRDAMGSSAAVSNGFIRLPANLTRLFSVAVVDLHVLHAGQLDEALATAARVGGEMRDGSRLGGSDRHRCTDRRLGHRDRHGRGHDPAPAAGPGRRPAAPSRASSAGGWPRPSWRHRSGPGAGTRRCRSSASPRPRLSSA